MCLHTLHSGEFRLALFEKRIFLSCELLALQLEPDRALAGAGAFSSAGTRAPLSLRELETQAVQHELMLVREDVIRPGFLGRDLQEVFERMDWNVLIDGAVGHACEAAAGHMTGLVRTQTGGTFLSRVRGDVSRRGGSGGRDTSGPSRVAYPLLPVCVCEWRCWQHGSGL